MMSEHSANSYPLMELNNPEPRPHSDTVGIMGLKSERKAFPLKHCDYEMAFQRSMKNDVSRRAERTLIFVSLLTLLFIIAELIGGYLAHSLAIVSDAFHMISDLGSFLISITAIHLARKKPTARYSYGFQRTEVLGALTSILIIWILTGVLIYMAIERILTNDLEVEADTMMITAGIGVVFNMVMGVCLYFGKAGHSHFGMSHSHHHHGHSHGHGQKVSNVENLSEKTIKSIDEEAHQHHHSHHHHHQENINLRAAFVHVLGDLVQSMGVLLAAVIIKFTGFTLADPICTFLFGVLVLSKGREFDSGWAQTSKYANLMGEMALNRLEMISKFLLTTHGIFKDTILVLMEATPNHVSMNKVHEDLTSIDGVSSIHSLRIWSLKLDSTAISVHLDIQPGADVSAVVRQAQHKLQHEHGIDYITVQAQCSLSNASSEVQLLGV